MRHLPFKPSRRPKVKAKVVRRPQPSNWLGGAYTVLLALMTATIAAQLIASSLAAMPPLVTVGDRFALAPSPRPSAVNLPILAAAQIATPQAATGRACLLDLQKMLHPGGVFTVLAVRPDGVVLSWAGGQTAGNGAGCATTAPIFIAQNDYVALLNTRRLKH
jgi:hypothetical protein